MVRGAMVRGLDRFREYFAGFEDRYAIIGGTACSLLFDEAGLDYRATKDIDMVLCVEVLDAEFARQLAAFIDAAGYEARERGSGHHEFYRFHRPRDESFPFMIEIFSRQPDNLELPEESSVVRLTVEDDVISLSAILLDPDYYAALQSETRIIDAVRILDHTILILFKARAFIDLSRRRDAGEEVKGDDIRKHRNDVFRLLQLFPADASVEVTDPLKDDLRQFLDTVETEVTLSPRSFGVPLERDEAVALLRGIYDLPSPAAVPSP